MAGEEAGLDKTDTRENSNLSPSYLNSILKTDGISQQSISFSQEIKKNDPIVTIESDKSSVEIPSNIEGKIDKINVKIGDKVSKGDLLLTIFSSKSSSKILNNLPKNTENIIQDVDKNNDTNIAIVE